MDGIFQFQWVVFKKTGRPATGRAAPPSSVPVHENLFLKVPDEVFANVLQYWRSARDP